ncbi:MAG: cell division protein FtsQ/DivIB [Chthoniobacterales bacterium]
MKRSPTPRPRARNERVSNPRQRKQQHLLDVKVRSHKATQHRNHRILVVVSKVALCLLLLGGLIYGARYGAQRLFFNNPDYRLSKIEVQTDGLLARDLVLKTAELHEGENIFSVNLARVHDRLQQMPQVDEVQVVRNMPAEIDIKIIERKPIAWITSENEVTDPFASEAAFLVDARGVLMKEKKLLPEYLGLPVIVGCPNESMAAGQTISSFEAKAALELLRLSARSFMQTRFQVRQIDLSKGYCLLVTDKNHARVTFDFDDLDGQLHRLEQFLVYCEDSRRELETVNLMVKRNTPVTFAKLPSEVINETIDPEGEEPKILRATPVHPETAAKSKNSETKIRRAFPVERGKRN